MKRINLVTLILVSYLLTSCSSNEKKEAAPQQQPAVLDCVFPNTEVLAPKWICDEPIAEVDIQAVGTADFSSAGYSFMKDLAAADARGKIAAQFKVRVQKMVKSYFGTTGANETETVDKVSESVLKTITNQTLSGSRIYKSRTGPNRKMYVLVGLDNEKTKLAAEHAVNTSINNEQALWQQFKSEQGFKELAKEIANQEVK